MISRNALTPALCIAWLIAIILALGWVESTPSSPQRFTTSHDFGNVYLSGHEVKVHHTFHYRNDEPVVDEVEHVKSSCGCATTDVSTRWLSPGETMALPTTLTISAAGAQTSSVWLVMKHAGVTRFKVFAVGISREDAYLVESHVQAHGHRTTVLHTVCVTFDEVPPALTMDVLNGSATFEGWTLIRAAEPGDGIASRWHGRVSVVANVAAEGLVPRTTTVQIRFDGQSAQSAFVHW